MTWTSDDKIQWKKIGLEWHDSILLSHHHENDHFLPFFTVQSQGIEQTKTLLFILKVLWCSIYLMQKMTSVAPSIYEIIYLKVFLKNFAQQFYPFARF